VRDCGPRGGYYRESYYGGPRGHGHGYGHYEGRGYEGRGYEGHGRGHGYGHGRHGW